MMPLLKEHTAARYHKKMDLSKIIIVTRTTPIDFDMREYNVNSFEELMKIYKNEKLPQDIIDEKIRRHFEQKAFLEELETSHGFSQAQFIRNDELAAKQDLIKKAGMVVSFGGDDTFTRVSHFIGNTPILGLKADSRSYGSLLYYNRKNIGAALQRIEKDGYRLEQWTRLQAFVRGNPIEQAIGQYVLSATFAEKYMGKFCIQHKSMIEEVWGSELIIYTGAGSTGQARSSTWYLGDRAKPLKPTEKRAMFALTNPYSPDKHPFERYGLLCGELAENDELIVISKCKTKGQLHRQLKLETGHITADSIEDYFFREGSEIKVRISDKPLNTVYIPEVAVSN